ncbi:MULTISPECIES: TetR/AcrR family transcriptional regulator [Burkholderia]|jgi:TetR/AcrR family transcriptional regulator, transcriptional repressor for nem operon|uniref:TetR family transcriptional regulator n=2 Tax=Burkholderia contaminans TaxID=488447 RepID=A0A1E3FLR3_9BURK|nr:MULTISPECIES: TetR/AcrR family transcriptional regulator [Burkholderia]UTP24697.1 TetR family transcriptional regulator [Burkholderia sp. FXe9]KKL32270.1 TetR family transcriptional regulator [Burkholderia contaminans LMG 23361]MBA9834477.1 TetR family transcriptional regulator [Burkholderia contaminans]MBA9840721.1 TetR family transcriptional regulator [Burkholderia contaminans]MBA9865759.1 TetR family transcriptional regulator [Burkholderia contaminans]
MRKSRAETAETRQRIVEIAAQQFRSKGIQGTGLNDVMSEAGLTHGGFYRHFESKNQLLAEAFELALSSVVDSLSESARKTGGKAGFASMVNSYVSRTHRDNAADGCPFAGMGSELARADELTREAATLGLSKMVEALAEHIGSGEAGDDMSHPNAMFALSAMVGAITLSRIVSDPKTSDALLKTVKRHLIEL